MGLPYSDNVKLLDAITADVAAVTALGTNTLDVSKRQLRSIQFVCASHTSGNGVFTVYVSNDGTNWVQYNRLTDNVVNAIAEGDVRVASCTLNSNSNKIYFFPAGDYFRYIGVACDVTTDGAYSAILEAAG